MLDVYVFQAIRERSDAWWAAPALSTIVANVIDTYSFFYVAFAGSLDAEGNMSWIGANWHIVAQNNTLTKIVVGLVVFLPAYGLLLSYLGKKVATEPLVLKDEVKPKKKAKKSTKKKA
jgi:uncharacterized integral membrane protein (TIGR00697 family)